MDIRKLTDGMAQVAREAGDYLRTARRDFHPERVENKHPHDYVSYVDRSSERLIVERLRVLLPGAGFVTEEGTTAEDGKECESEYEFVIDPLDGTTNYIRDNAPYCVCIALRSRKEILSGVVYEVCRDELYMACCGGSALLNGQPLHVSRTEDLNQAYAFLELPYNVEDYKETGLSMYRQMYGRVACLRMPGSAAAAMCYVAAGRFDIWFESFIGVWDYSAAALIVRCAGGTVTDFFGNPDILNTNHIVVTNGPLHAITLQMLQKALPRGIN